MTTVDKVAWGLSLIAVVCLLCFIIFSQKGFIEYQALKEQQQTLKLAIEAQELRTKKLTHEIISLKTDMEYIRHVAKHEHDMAEPDELVIKDKDITAKQQAKGKP